MAHESDVPQRNVYDLREALEHVTRQLLEVEKERKASLKAYKERIDDLKSERDAIVEQLGELGETP